MSGVRLYSFRFPIFSCRPLVFVICSFDFRSSIWFRGFLILPIFQLCLSVFLFHFLAILLFTVFFSVSLSCCLPTCFRLSISSSSFGSEFIDAGLCPFSLSLFLAVATSSRSSTPFASLCLFMEPFILSFTFPWRFALFAVLFMLLSFSMAVQVVRGAFQHLFQVWGRYPGAGFLHAVFIRCTANELYCDVVCFLFLVHEPWCGALHFLFSFQFMFLSIHFSSFSSFQCSCASVLKFFIPSVFRFLSSSVFRFSVAVMVVFAFWEESSKALSLDPSTRVASHPVPFFWACRQGPSVRKVRRSHHWHCCSHAIVSTSWPLSTTWSSFSSVSLQLFQFSGSPSFRLSSSSSFRCVLHCPVFWFFPPFLIRFSGFGLVGRGGSSFRLSSSSKFSQFSIFVIRFSERPPVFTPRRMASSWSSYSGVQFSGFSGAVHLTIFIPSTFLFVVSFSFPDLSILPDFQFSVLLFTFVFLTPWISFFLLSLVVFNLLVVLVAIHCIFIIHLSRASSAHIDIMFFHSVNVLNSLYCLFVVCGSGWK